MARKPVTWESWKKAATEQAQELRLLPGGARRAKPRRRTPPGEEGGLPDRPEEEPLRGKPPRQRPSRRRAEGGSNPSEQEADGDERPRRRSSRAVRDEEEARGSGDDGERDDAPERRKRRSGKHGDRRHGDRKHRSRRTGYPDSAQPPAIQGGEEENPIPPDGYPDGPNPNAPMDGPEMPPRPLPAFDGPDREMGPGFDGPGHPDGPGFGGPDHPDGPGFGGPDHRDGPGFDGPGHPDGPGPAGLVGAGLVGAGLAAAGHAGSDDDHPDGPEHPDERFDNRRRPRRPRRKGRAARRRRRQQRDYRERGRERERERDSEDDRLAHMSEEERMREREHAMRRHPAGGHHMHHRGHHPHHGGPMHGGAMHRGGALGNVVQMTVPVGQKVGHLSEYGMSHVEGMHREEERRRRRHRHGGGGGGRRRHERYGHDHHHHRDERDHHRRGRDHRRERDGSPTRSEHELSMRAAERENAHLRAGGRLAPSRHSSDDEGGPGGAAHGSYDGSAVDAEEQSEGGLRERLKHRRDSGGSGHSLRSAHSGRSGGSGSGGGVRDKIKSALGAVAGAAVAAAIGGGSDVDGDGSKGSKASDRRRRLANANGTPGLHPMHPDAFGMAPIPLPETALPPAAIMGPAGPMGHGPGGMGHSHHPGSMGGGHPGPAGFHGGHNGGPHHMGPGSHHHGGPHHMGPGSHHHHRRRHGGGHFNDEMHHRPHHVERMEEEMHRRRHYEEAGRHGGRPAHLERYERHGRHGRTERYERHERHGRHERRRRHDDGYDSDSTAPSGTDGGEPAPERDDLRRRPSGRKGNNGRRKKGGGGGRKHRPAADSGSGGASEERAVRRREREAGRLAEGGGRPGKYSDGLARADDLDSLASKRAQDVMTTASAQIPAGSLSILEKFLPKNNVPSAANAAKAAADPGFLELPSMGENESLAEDALQRESKKSPFMVEVPEKFAYIVERFGKFKRRLDAGWHVLLPFVDRVRFVHSLHEQPMPLPQTGCTTKDGVPITAAGVLFVKVVDPVSASYTVENPFRSLLILAQACVKNVVGERRMRDAVAARAQVGEMLQEEINETVGPWGLSVTRFELTDLEPPEETAALLRDEAERGMQREIEMARVGHVVPSAGRADDGVGVPSAGNAYDDGRELLHAPVGASAARAGSLADTAGYPAPPPAAPSAAAHEAAPPPAATPSPYAPAYYEPPVAPPAAPSAAAAVAGSVDHDAAPDSLASIQILGASWGGAMTRRASEAAHPPVGLPMEADPPTAAAHEQHLAAEHTHLLPPSHEVASVVAHAAAPPQTVLRTPPPPPVPEDPYTPSAPLPETAPTAAAAPPPPAWSGLPQLTLAGGGTLQPVYAAAPGFVPPHALHAFVSNAGGEHPQFVQIAVPVAEGSGGGGNPGLPPAFAPVQATHPAAQG